MGEMGRIYEESRTVANDRVVVERINKLERLNHGARSGQVIWRTKS